MTTSPHADVTAVIPVYNGQAFLRDAVESVISQTLPPAQLVVVDDGSTDRSLEVLDRIESPIPIVRVSQKNAGQSAARNRGVSLARSPFIAFLDQDDRWYPRHIEVLIQPLLGDPAVGWVYSNLDLIAGDNRTIKPGLLSVSGSTHPKTSLRDCLSEDNMFILPSASILRKEALERAGGFDERLSGYEDDDLFLRLFREGWKNVYIPEPLSAWRLHTSSSMHSTRMIESRLIYANKLLNEFPDLPEQGCYHTRDCLAPRFYRLNAVDYWRGVGLRDPRLCSEALRAMRRLAPLFDNRLGMRLRLHLMRYSGLARAVGRLHAFVANRPRSGGGTPVRA
jgi:glycosyltransferase involved in cell wall biosynthesis